MPHAKDPTQLATDTDILYDPNGNAVVNDWNKFEDPRGGYLGTAEIAFSNSGSSNDPASFKIENQGKDLLIDSVNVIASQGAETGRGYAFFGWDMGEGHRSQEWIAPKLGTSGENGRGRQTVTYQFPEGHRPLWEFKDELYVSLECNSGSTDEYKQFAWVRAITADGHEDSRL